MCGCFSSRRGISPRKRNRKLLVFNDPLGLVSVLVVFVGGVAMSATLIVVPPISRKIPSTNAMWLDVSRTH